MIHRSYVFVNRKTEISEKIFHGRCSHGGRRKITEEITRSRAKIPVRVTEKRQNADPHQKISYFFEKYAFSLLTNE